MQFRSIIKGRYTLLLLSVLCLALAFCLAFLPDKTFAVTRAENAAQGLNEYRYDIRFSPSEQLLYVTMELDYTNDTGKMLQDLVLRTYANAYQSEETSPAAIDYFYDSSYKQGFSAGSLALEGIWWNEQIITDWQYTDTAQTVLRVPIASLAPTEKGLLRLRCRIQIPECAHRFGYSQGMWQFGNALPILSLYQDGAWRTDPYCAIGDPFVSVCANYTVAITSPYGYTCAASAPVTTEKTSDGLRFSMHGMAMRDFAFVLSRDWVAETAKADDVIILAYAANEKTAGAAARYAAKAVKIYSKLYGDYPWPQLTVCMVDFPAGGMEYPGLFFLSNAYENPNLRASMELTIAHETAHQWFYALVGSDQYNQPWQDEALSEYALLQYVKERYGQSSYENLRYARILAPMEENIVSRVTPASPVDHFGSYTDYSTVVYGRGAALIDAVEQMTVDVNSFLRSYCDTFAFDFASREDFDRHLNEWSGMDLSPLVLDYIDTYIN